MKAFAYQGEVKQEAIPKLRAMTLTGLVLFLDVTLETWRQYRAREDLSEVVTRAEQVIYDQKFSGAAADLLNANIIARDLGLKDQQQIEDVTPRRTFQPLTLVTIKNHLLVQHRFQAPPEAYCCMQRVKQTMVTKQFCSASGTH